MADGKLTPEEIQKITRDRMKDVGGPGNRPYEYEYVPRHQRRETVDPARENPFDRRRDRSAK